jgi:predicted RNA-binding Zn-ribbon protein involved in translation (DUF1610 family)
LAYQKLYREKHKLELAHKRKKYRNEHKEELSNKQKTYQGEGGAGREKNLAYQKAYHSVRFTCPHCQKEMSRRCIKAHIARHKACPYFSIIIILMSLTLTGTATMSNNQIYLTKSSNQTGFATVNVALENNFLLRTYYQATGSNSVLTTAWRDASNVQYSLTLNQAASNVVLVGNSSNLLTSNIPILPAGGNLIALRQTLGASKFYVNDVLQFNYLLANELNPQGGVFTFTGSNGLSNIISSVAIDNAFTVSNATKFLQDVSIAGVVLMGTVGCST